MNMEKPITIDVRDLTHALTDADNKARELRQQAAMFKTQIILLRDGVVK